MGGGHMGDRRHRSGRFLPLLGVFAGGLVYSLLPHGAFGAYDFVVRAAITGTVAGGTFLVLLVMTNRWVGVSRGENSSKSN
jgi:hypothetical protein